MEGSVWLWLWFVRQTANTDHSMVKMTMDVGKVLRKREGHGLC